MAHMVLAGFNNGDEALGGINALSIILLCTLDETLTLKGAEAKSWFEGYRADMLRQWKNGTEAKGSITGEVAAIRYGITCLEIVFQAVESKFDAKGHFDRSK